MRLIFLQILALLICCEAGYGHIIPFALLKQTAQLDPAWTPQWSNLKAYWKMDGNGAISSGYAMKDYFGNSTATSNAAGLSFVIGKLSQGVQFDGTNYFTIPKTAAANVCTAMTVMLWVKWNAPASPGWGSLINSWNGCSTTDAGWNIVQNGATKTTQFSVNTSAAANYVASNTSDVFDGNWHHIAVTVTAGGVIKIYADGVQEGTTTTSMGTGICTTTTTMTFGGARCSSPLGSGAILDEIAIWNAVLSVSEIQTIYNKQRNVIY